MDTALLSDIPNRFSDRDLLMREHWALGIGHLPASGHRPQSSSSITEGEPGVPSNPDIQAANDGESDVSISLHVDPPAASLDNASVSSPCLLDGGPVEFGDEHGEYAMSDQEDVLFYESDEDPE